MRWRTRCHRERTLTGAHDAGANPAYPVPRVDVVCAAASAKTRAMARATRAGTCADAHDGSVLLRATGAWKLLNRAQQLGA